MYLLYREKYTLFFESHTKCQFCIPLKYLFSFLHSLFHIALIVLKRKFPIRESSRRVKMKVFMILMRQKQFSYTFWESLRNLPIIQGKVHFIFSKSYKMSILHYCKIFFSFIHSLFHIALIVLKKEFPIRESSRKVQMKIFMSLMRQKKFFIYFERPSLMYLLYGEKQTLFFESHTKCQFCIPLKYLFSFVHSLFHITLIVLKKKFPIRESSRKVKMKAFMILMRQKKFFYTF